MLVVSACSEAPQSTPPPNAPFETAGEEMPVVPGSTMGGTEGTAPSAGSPEPMRSEGMNEDVELVSPEPVEPAPQPSVEPVVDEAVGQPVPVPAIGEPGFPVGSAPRLVPLEFVGPITGQPVRFNVYLPPGYDSGTASYPVLYDLHGLTDSRDTNPGPVIGSLEAAMRNLVIGPLIVVFPQGFVEAYWADTRDGARPGETQVIQELLPYVEANFRTLAHRARRGVSGFSMGGFGAFAYAMKYPERFSVGIGYDSALDTWQTLLGRRANIAAAAFGNDESSFDQISPWANADAQRGSARRLRGATRRHR